MNHIKRIRRFASILVGLAGALLAFAAAAPAAFAVKDPPTGPGSVVSQPPPVAHTVVRTVVVGGMPGWQIALIAAAAALVAATAAVLLTRARAGQRKAITAAA